MIDLLTATPLGWALLFLLGVRHGLDPDHIAVIDGFALRAAERRRSTAGLTGVLFSVGHTLSVAAVAVGVGALGARLRPPPGLADVMDWLSIALLLAVGGANLVALSRADGYRPAGWRRRLTGWVQTGDGPTSVLLTGVVFGLMFDTATQAAAWGAAAGARGGVGEALAVALVFGAGMTATDGLDGWVLARVLRTGGPEKAARYRRAVGWGVVALAFGMAGWELWSKLFGGADDGAVALGVGAAAAALVIGTPLLVTLRPRLRAGRSLP